MELFDLLEQRVMDLYKEVLLLREENNMLKVTSVGLAEMREENRVLKEALEREQSIHEQIHKRIDNLLETIHETNIPS